MSDSFIQNRINKSYRKLFALSAPSIREGQARMPWFKRASRPTRASFVRYRKHAWFINTPSAGR